MQHNSLVVIRKTELTMPAVDPKAIEEALMIGDLSKMSPTMRVQFYVGACQSIGLNPYTKPFDAIKGDDGAVSLYANKAGTEQLRRIYNVSLRTVRRERIDGLYVVAVLASLPNGREEEAIGAVPLEEPRGAWKTSQNGKRYFEPARSSDGEAIYDTLRGDKLANAMKKAETQAKRRATLGICGLGFADAEGAGGTNVAFDPQQGTLEEERQASMVAQEQHKSMREHIADIFGDADPEEAAPQISSELVTVDLEAEPVTVDAETGRPDGLDEPPALIWLTDAKATAQALREAEIAGSLQGEAGLAVLSDLEGLIRDPDRYTQAQRIMRMTRADKLRGDVMPF